MLSRYTTLKDAREMGENTLAVYMDPFFEIIPTDESEIFT